jgi:hypothetical protein
MTTMLPATTATPNASTGSTSILVELDGFPLLAMDLELEPLDLRVLFGGSFSGEVMPTR